jgi:hypothetical protein
VNRERSSENALTQALLYAHRIALLSRAVRLKPTSSYAIEKLRMKRSRSGFEELRRAL